MNIPSCEILTKKTYSSCVWWHPPVILAFRRQRQEDFTLRLASARKPCDVSSKTRPRTKEGHSFRRPEQVLSTTKSPGRSWHQSVFKS